MEGVCNIRMSARGKYGTITAKKKFLFYIDVILQHELSDNIFIESRIIVVYKIYV